MQCEGDVLGLPLGQWDAGKAAQLLHRLGYRCHGVVQIELHDFGAIACSRVGHVETYGNAVFGYGIHSQTGIFKRGVALAVAESIEESVQPGWSKSID